MQLVSDPSIRIEDFRPKIEEVNYVRMTFTLPEHHVCFGDLYDELAHRKVPEDERRLLGLMLTLTRHNGYRVKKLLLDELLFGMGEWGLFEDADAEELIRFVEAGIREHHVHGPFSEEGYEKYLASKVEDEEKNPAEAA